MYTYAKKLAGPSNINNYSFSVTPENNLCGIKIQRDIYHLGAVLFCYTFWASPSAVADIMQTNFFLEGKTCCLEAAFSLEQGSEQWRGPS